MVWRSMVKKQHGRIQWSGWEILYHGLQLNRTRPNFSTFLHQPLAPTLLQHSSPMMKGPTGTLPCLPWSPIHWWRCCWNSRSLQTTSNLQNGTFQATPLSRLELKNVQSLIMARAVTKYCSVQRICTSCLLQKVCESQEEELSRTSRSGQTKLSIWKKNERTDLARFGRNLFCTVVLTSPSFAYLTCKLHGNTCNRRLWRLDDCEDEVFLSSIPVTKCAPHLFNITSVLGNICPYGPKINLFARVLKLHPQDQDTWSLCTKVRLQYHAI